MQDLINNIDSRIEHQFHNTYDDNCSTCFSENLVIKTKVNCVCKEVCYWCGNTGMTPNDDESLGGADWWACENHDYRNGELSVNAEEALKRFPAIL